MPPLRTAIAPIVILLAVVALPALALAAASDPALAAAAKGGISSAQRFSAAGLIGLTAAAILPVVLMIARQRERQR